MRNRALALFGRASQLFAVVLVLLAGASCKGGASERPLFDPLHADRLAHTALITAKELPGLSWRVATEDEFSVPSALDAGPPECAGPRRLLTDTATGLIGHAQRGFELPSPQFTRVGTTVFLEVFVYDLETKPDLLVVTLRDLVRNGSLAKCLAEVRNAGRLLSQTDVTPSTKVPTNGAAMAFDREFTALNGPPLTRRDELFLWQQSNVVVLLSISTPKDIFKADVARIAVKAVQDNVLKTSKAN